MKVEWMPTKEQIEHTLGMFSMSSSSEIDRYWREQGLLELGAESLLAYLLKEGKFFDFTILDSTVNCLVIPRSIIAAIKEQLK